MTHLHTARIVPSGARLSRLCESWRSRNWSQWSQDCWDCAWRHTQCSVAFCIIKCSWISGAGCIVFTETDRDRERRQGQREKRRRKRRDKKTREEKRQDEEEREEAWPFSLLVEWIVWLISLTTVTFACYILSSMTLIWLPDLMFRVPITELGNFYPLPVLFLGRSFFQVIFSRFIPQNLIDNHFGQHSTHFPEDRNCEICQRTKTTKGPCRRCKGEAVPRAENFGDLTTADHKVLSDNYESRNNHRYAVVVQDLATQWIQAYPCKTKTSQETHRSWQKFLEPERKPKVIYTDNSLEFGKACEDLSWNHCTSTPHRSETNGIAERAVRRVKEGTSAVLLQSGLNESWWADSMECYTYLRNVTDLLSCLMGRRPMKDVLGNHLEDQLFLLVHWWSITL